MSDTKQSPESGHDIPVTGVETLTQVSETTVVNDGLQQAESGASFSVASVADTSGTAALSLGGQDRSAALLSLASSCSLSEILNAQQQALEQIHTQVHINNQFETINQRLDAIEKTLSNLIHHRQQTEAVHQVVVNANPHGTAVSETSDMLHEDQSGTTGLNDMSYVADTSLGDKKSSKKLPRELCVRKCHCKNFKQLGVTCRGRSGRPIPLWAWNLILMKGELYLKLFLKLFLQQQVCGQAESTCY